MGVQLWDQLCLLMAMPPGGTEEPFGLLLMEKVGESHAEQLKAGEEG